MAVVAIAMVGVFCVEAPAAPGDLDLSFGATGKVVVGSGRARCATVQADGKILLGDSLPGSNLCYLWRLNANGSLDTSFGGTGQGYLGIHSAYNDFLTPGNFVAVEEDGKIVAVGEVSLSRFPYWGLAIQRLNPNGSADTTFGSGSGIAHLADGHATCVVIQADGKLVVGGYKDVPYTLTQPMLARFNRDGSLDTSFGSMGNGTTTLNDPGKGLKSMALQADGKIVAIGGVTTASDPSPLLVRFNPDGSLDASFGIGGYPSVGPGLTVGVAVQSDGKILVSGLHGYFDGAVDGTIWRYNADGGLDMTFGRNGFAGLDLIPFGSFYSIAVQNDGKIVGVGGSSTSGTNHTAFFAARFLPNGSPDRTFHGTGWVTTDFSPDDNAPKAVAVQTDGKIVAAGYSGNWMAAVRYQGDPVTPFAAWKLAHLGQANPPDLGDPDGDGLSTLAEYGLAFLPEIPNTAPAVTLYDDPKAGRRLRMFVQRDPAHSDVTVEVQSAGDVTGPWTTVAASVLGAPFLGPGYVAGDGVTPGVKTVEVRDPMNVNDATQRFMRARVTH